MYSIINNKANKRDKDLFESGINSDITIISSDGEKFNLHKCILSEVKYFQLMFSDKFSDNKKKSILIKSTIGKVLKEVFRYIYYSELLFDDYHYLL